MLMVRRSGSRGGVVVSCPEVIPDMLGGGMPVLVSVCEEQGEVGERRNSELFTGKEEE